MKKMKQASTPTTSRISSFVILVVFITLALSLIALVFSITIMEENSDAAWIMLALGILGVGISTYVLVETRRRLFKTQDSDSARFNNNRM